jgi:catechol 2,3-dioxygenase-like lactoylglutathione lyase family enzyme
MSPAIHRIIIYTKKPREMAAFYTGFFGYQAVTRDRDRIIELRPSSGGLTLLLHPASKGQKEGQALVKLVFDAEDVERCCAELKARGLAFGPIHEANGYSFANAKDPSGNSISISSRAFAALGD